MTTGVSIDAESHGPVIWGFIFLTVAALLLLRP
jgi:hypothetical protein